MPSFRDDVIFPENVSYGSQGGPGYNSLVILKNSGFEDRAALHVYPLHTYDAAFGIVRMEAEEGSGADGLEDVISTFHVCDGMVYGMLYKDHGDYKSGSYNSTATAVDLSIGTGDAIETIFQIVKTYTRGSTSKVRLIKKPKQGTILIAVNGVTQTETTHYTIDYTTGLVTFVTPPPDGHAVTWGGEFYVPVRFATDDLSITLSHYISGQCTVPLMEIKV